MLIQIDSPLLVQMIKEQLAAMDEQYTCTQGLIGGFYNAEGDYCQIHMSITSGGDAQPVPSHVFRLPIVIDDPEPFDTDLVDHNALKRLAVLTGAVSTETLRKKLADNLAAGNARQVFADTNNALQILAGQQGKEQLQAQVAAAGQKALAMMEREVVA